MVPLTRFSPELWVGVKSKAVELISEALSYKSNRNNLFEYAKWSILEELLLIHVKIFKYSSLTYCES